MVEADATKIRRQAAAFDVFDRADDNVASEHSAADQGEFDRSCWAHNLFSIHFDLTIARSGHVRVYRNVPEKSLRSSETGYVLVSEAS